jgi:hypothetical protein
MCPYFPLAARRDRCIALRLAEMAMQQLKACFQTARLP